MHDSQALGAVVLTGPEVLPDIRANFRIVEHGVIGSITG